MEISGDDYDTPDGTGVRDYIHITDLVNGHIAALAYAQNHRRSEIFNLGTGKGYSVYEVVRAFEAATSRNVPYQIKDRRRGDIDMFYADPSKAKSKLGWVAKLGLEQMCRDSGAGRKISLVTQKNSQRTAFFTIIRFHLGYFLSNMLCQQN